MSQEREESTVTVSFSSLVSASLLVALKICVVAIAMKNECDGCQIVIVFHRGVFD